MSTVRVLVTDPLAESAKAVLHEADGIEVVERLKPSADELKALLEDVDGIIIRSGTKITADVLPDGDRLKVIGRAGMGVDNVDVEAASRKGIVVMNTPGGNSTTTAEHAIALMMAVARNIRRHTP